LCKAELIRNKAPYRGIDDVEIAIAEYIDCSITGDFTARLEWSNPVEHEQRYYSETPYMKTTKATELSLH
jgi:putative transposase